MPTPRARPSAIVAVALAGANQVAWFCLPKVWNYQRFLLCHAAHLSPASRLFKLDRHVGQLSGRQLAEAVDILCRRSYNHGKVKQAKNKLTVAQIATLAGVSVQLVQRKRAMGKSDHVIVAEAVLQAHAAAQKRPTVVPTDVVNGHANGHAANGNGALSYSGAQAAKENALAELRQLELAQRRRELVPLAYLRAWASRFLTEGRDLLINGLSELQDKLAVESDALKVAAILRFWVDHVMTRFFSLETLWGGGELPDQDALRERFDTARLAVVKPRQEAAAMTPLAQLRWCRARLGAR